MSNTGDQVRYWIGLSSIPGVGRTTFRRLVKRFGSPEAALSLPREGDVAVEGVPDRVFSAIRTFPWNDAAERELDRAASAGASIIIEQDPAYPAILRGIADAPLYLYVIGILPSDQETAVAIVGTRRPTHYGANIARRMAADLATAGITVVSGMARGIDSEAHKAALKAGGRTIAVLGCGIDVVYPPENRTLRDAICGSGAIVSENPFGTQPEAGYFPARNRIISGFSKGAVIVEATDDSGSLITAQYALEQGRKLFAVPGNIGSPSSRGTNNLIKEGAVLVESASDVLAGIDAPAGVSRQRHTAPLPGLSTEENAVLACISGEPRHIDSIMKTAGMGAGALGGLLVTLELKGCVRQLPGKYFVLNDPS